MATFLLTWNPSSFEWDTLADDVAAVSNGEMPETPSWSIGGRKSGVEPGDRFFMLRQGVEPRGIMASGRLISEIWRGGHWSGSGTAGFVDIVFDVLIDPVDEPDLVIPIEELVERFEGRFYFKRVQSSGQRLPDDVAEELEQMWSERVGQLADGDDASPSDEPGDETAPVEFETDEDESNDFERLPEQVTEELVFVEGATRTVTINYYERSAAARQGCLDHWGTSCSVCDFNFAEAYGEIGEGYIHVHHLKSLADIGEEYEVDPIADLRPICPNCHAMIHRREPPYSISELRTILRR